MSAASDHAMDAFVVDIPMRSVPHTEQRIVTRVKTAQDHWTFYIPQLRRRVRVVPSSTPGEFCVKMEYAAQAIPCLCGTVKCKARDVCRMQAATLNRTCRLDLRVHEKVRLYKIGTTRLPEPYQHGDIFPSKGAAAVIERITIPQRKGCQYTLYMRWAQGQAR